MNEIISSHQYKLTPKFRRHLDGGEREWNEECIFAINYFHTLAPAAAGTILSMQVERCYPELISPYGLSRRIPTDSIRDGVSSLYVNRPTPCTMLPTARRDATILDARNYTYTKTL
jgi:hypothetical protein